MAETNRRPRQRPYGTSGITVSELAFGAGHLGGADLDDERARALVSAVVDSGANLIDTAPSYGCSETRLGKILGGDTSTHVLLSTKVGYGVPGVGDWTGPCITKGIEVACRKLRREQIDLVHLHSCGRDVLERGEVIEALLAARQAGKVRLAAYSGDGEALEWAIDSGHFDGVQCSYNLVDRAAADAIGRAARKGMGVILKRPLCNAVWRFDERPEAFDLSSYWDRWQALQLGDGDRAQALPFALRVEGASCAIVGTSRRAHWQQAVEASARALTDAQLERYWERYAQVGASWPGLI
ncbi:MAG: aldo/keto reductase [Proteobacteria bacterium]|nr:MAG: aldo/keto reductase [Pseudomonadota bacterium]